MLSVYSVTLIPVFKLRLLINERQICIRHSPSLHFKIDVITTFANDHFPSRENELSKSFSLYLYIYQCEILSQSQLKNKTRATRRSPLQKWLFHSIPPSRSRWIASTCLGGDNFLPRVACSAQRKAAQGRRGARRPGAFRVAARPTMSR